MAHIEVENLSFAYEVGGRSVEVLRDVSFKIAAGDYVAIQGPSGSGKSTLFYVLGCLLKPTSGRVLLNGKDLARVTDDEAAYLRNRMIGFVFQQFHLLPRATVLDNILLPCSYPAELSSDMKARRARAIKLADRLGLSEHLTRHPNQLSGGQQQRVAIARALINDVDLILADEPTGNLDSRTAQEILTIFDELQAQGKTVVVITHDGEVARRAQRILQVRDGRLVGSTGPVVESGEVSATKLPQWRPNLPRLAMRSLPGAFANLLRNRAKSLLTMLGVIIGIAAVLAMISLGQFTKARILEGFEALGVNKLVVRGNPNWEMKATDKSSVTFGAFNWEKDLLPLRRLFPEIVLISPVMSSWQNTAMAGGKSLSEGVRMRGINHEYFAISNAHLAKGRPITPYHVDAQTQVCVLGSEIAQGILTPGSEIGAMISVSMDQQTSFPCQVIGVLEPQKSNQEWFQPNLQILMPYTAYQSVGSFWNSQIREFAIQVRSESDVENTALKIKAYFDSKYGRSGRFTVDSEGTLVAQTKRFLNIFAALLAAIAFLSLLVGGIGIHNMMLVSVSERLKEIGLRKALGATKRSIKVQVLVESTALCLVAGLLGIAAGVTATELMIYAATKFIKTLQFEWLIDPWALVISFVSILAVGILSGLVPAVRAERLQVIEALRSE